MKPWTFLMAICRTAETWLRSFSIVIPIDCILVRFEWSGKLRCSSVSEQTSEVEDATV
jgi:hypothetical protein